MVFQSHLHHFQRMQLSQVKYLNDAAEAFQNRAKNTSLRTGILKKQKKRYFQSEYERIINHVENSAAPALTQTRLTARVAHLKT